MFIFGFCPVYTRRFPFNLGKDFVHPADVVLHLRVQNLGVRNGLFKIFDVFRAFHRAGLPNTARFFCCNPAMGFRRFYPPTKVEFT